MRVLVLLLSLVSATSFADPLTDAPPQRLAKPRLDGLAIGGATLLVLGASMAIGAVVAVRVAPSEPTPPGCDICGGPRNLGAIAAVGVVGALATVIATPLFIVGMKHHYNEKRALYVDRVSPLGIGGRF